LIEKAFKIRKNRKKISITIISIGKSEYTSYNVSNPKNKDELVKF